MIIKPKYIIRTQIEGKLPKRETELAKVCKKKNISQSQLARRADLEFSQVNAIWNGTQKDMYLSTAKRICNVVGMNLHALFKD